MARFAVRRILWMVATLFAVSLITFLLMHSVPGGPFTGERTLPEAVLENLERKYNLDDPLPVQYINYLEDLTIPRVQTGEIRASVVDNFLIEFEIPIISTEEEPVTFRWVNFGPSLKKKSQSVNDIMRENLPVSFQLGMMALGVALLIGIPLGVMAALNRNTIYDYTGMAVAIIGVSVPLIVLGPFMQYIFGVELKWLPVAGWVSNAARTEWEPWHYMVMPAIGLGLADSALVARLTRASLLQVLNEDYIRTAYAKGLSRRLVIIRHALKNSMIPVITVIGPLFAGLVTGTFVVETIFSIPGMGRYFVTSVNDRDYTVIMGTILLYAGVLVIANLFVDMAYAWLDPRIRYE